MKSSILASNVIEDAVGRSNKQGLPLSFWSSGTSLELMELYAKDSLRRLQKVWSLKEMEIIGTPYYHSLAFLSQRSEFERQLVLFDKIAKKLFNKKPRILANTQLIYHNYLAFLSEKLGYKAILCEENPSSLKGRSANHIYAAPHMDHFPLLIRSSSLSDDVNLRFSKKDWYGYPLDATKYINWLKHSNGDHINLIFEFRSFGIEHRRSSGIHEFLETFLSMLKNEEALELLSLEEAIDRYRISGTVDVSDFGALRSPHTTASWTAGIRQQEALRKCYSFKASDFSKKKPWLLEKWSYLQNADWWLYMAENEHPDSPYGSGYDAYVQYMNHLADLEILLHQSS